MPEVYETNALQVEQEIGALTDVFVDEGVTSLLEIGAKFGGSLWRLAHALKPRSRIVAIDLPKGTKAWKESRGSLEGCIAQLNSEGYDAKVVWGDSADTEVIEQIRTLGPYDAIFIDADHRLSGVTADWNNYGPMARIVAFHDIQWRRAPEWVGVRIDVPEFWESIRDQYRHKEFRFCPTGKNNGIGVLWRH